MKNPKEFITRKQAQIFKHTRTVKWLKLEIGNMEKVKPKTAADHKKIASYTAELDKRLAAIKTCNQQLAILAKSHNKPRWISTKTMEEIRI